MQVRGIIGFTLLVLVSTCLASLPSHERELDGNGVSGQERLFHNFLRRRSMERKYPDGMEAALSTPPASNIPRGAKPALGEYMEKRRGDRRVKAHLAAPKIQADRTFSAYVARRQASRRAVPESLLQESDSETAVALAGDEKAKGIPYFTASLSGDLWSFPRYWDQEQVSGWGGKPGKKWLDVDEKHGHIKVKLSGGRGVYNIAFHIKGRQQYIVATCRASASSLSLTTAGSRHGWSIDTKNGYVVMPEPIRTKAWEYKTSLATLLVTPMYPEPRYMHPWYCFKCSGHEDNLHKCRRWYMCGWWHFWWATSFSHWHSVGVCCKDQSHHSCAKHGRYSYYWWKSYGKTRLDGQQKSGSGLVTDHWRMWSKVNKLFFNNNAAKVACRSMNLPYKSATWFRQGWNGWSHDAEFKKWKNHVFVQQLSGGGVENKGSFKHSNLPHYIGHTWHYSEKQGYWDGANEHDHGHFKLFSGDFNGDGRGDIAAASGIAWWWWYGHIFVNFNYHGSHMNSGGFYGSGFGWDMYYSWIGTRNNKLLTGDFNGDGYDDSQVRSATWYNSLSQHIRTRTGQGHEQHHFSYASHYTRHMWCYWHPCYTNRYKYVVGDFNGDGHADTVTFTKAWHYMDSFFHNHWAVDYGGGHDNYIHIRTTYYKVKTAQLMRSGNEKYYYDPINYTGLAGDFNGDGLDDIAVIKTPTKSRAHTFNSKISVELSNGKGFSQYWWSADTLEKMSSPVRYRYRHYVGDFNGDGKSDILTIGRCKNCGSGFDNNHWNNKMSLELSTGSGFTSKSWTSKAMAKVASTGDEIFEFEIVVKDINNDGLTDVVIYKAPEKHNSWWTNHIAVELSNGKGFTFKEYDSNVGDFMSRTTHSNRFFHTYVLDDKKCVRKCKHDGTIRKRECLCSCKYPWAGNSCEICTRPCHNGGTIDKGPCTCKCPYPWTGDHCETCSRKCLHNGRLSKGPCTCACDWPWGGGDCEKCLKKCQNGGHIDEEKCVCDCAPAKWWEGDVCDQPIFIDKEKDGHDMKEPLKIASRLLNEARSKCKPEAMPPLTELILADAKVHRNFGQHFDEYKFKLSVGVYDMYIHLKEQVNLPVADENRWQIMGTNPDPCEITQYESSPVEHQSRRDFEEPQVEFAFKYGMRKVNEKRSDCSLNAIEGGTIVGLKTQVVDGFIYTIDVQIDNYVNVEIVVRVDLQGKPEFDGSSPEACDIGSIRPAAEAGQDLDFVHKNIHGGLTDNNSPEFQEKEAHSLSPATLLQEEESYSDTQIPDLIKSRRLGEKPVYQISSAEKGRTWRMVDEDLSGTKIDFKPPSQFDARSQWPACFKDVFEKAPEHGEGACGMSAIMAVQLAFAQRTCSVTQQMMTLSVDHVVNCMERNPIDTEPGDAPNLLCAGSTDNTVWNFGVKEGFVANSCFPKNYTLTENRMKSEAVQDDIHQGSITTCPSSSLTDCPRLSVADDSWRQLYPGDSDGMMYQIHKWGAVVADIFVYEDFAKYRTGVYQPYSNSGTLMGTHSVVVIGWGHDDEHKTDYWLIENIAWGKEWGMNGYGKIIRSTTKAKELGIESRVSWADPMKKDCRDTECLHGGQQNPYTCSCFCDEEKRWTGNKCEVCPLVCQNGGRLSGDKCECECLPHTHGEVCENEDCRCSRCGPNFECGGTGDCPPKYDWCIKDHNQRMLMDLIEEDENAQDIGEVSGGKGDCPSTFMSCKLK